MTMTNKLLTHCNAMCDAKHASISSKLRTQFHELAVHRLSSLRSLFAAPLRMASWESVAPC